MSEKRSLPAATLSRSRVLIIVVAAVERFAYKGVGIQHGDVPHRRGGDEHVGAAKTVSTWMGVTSMLLLVSSVLGDSYWDRYSTIIAFSLIYVALASHDTQADKGTLLVSHCDHAEDSEPQEVVLQSNTAGSSTEHLASCEIKPVSLEGDSDSIDANEETHPVIQDSPQCRICLDNEGDDLIAPCHCKGTQKYVHRSCLDKWRSTKEGFAFSRCTECRAKFLLHANVPPDRLWLRLKFQLPVVRDHTLFFFIVQMVVVFLGMPVYSFYGDELRQMFGYEEHPYAFYALAILAIILVGVLYGFFIAIICGQRITERHYHVLAKTKDYIVQDLERTDLVPDLDPSHVTELRTRTGTLLRITAYNIRQAN